MAVKSKELEVITFKIDKSLSQMMKGIENRSEFIRLAILEALENVCPFCKGTGVLTPHRKKHWDKLANEHSSHKCRECDELVFECKSRR